jgi:hypothetical protein
LGGEGRPKEKMAITELIADMLLRFVDQVYVNTFRNLTDDGSVSHSHEFFSLFPDFSQLSDPRSVAVIPQVSYRIEKKETSWEGREMRREEEEEEEGEKGEKGED